MWTMVTFYKKSHTFGTGIFLIRVYQHTVSENVSLSKHRMKRCRKWIISASPFFVGVDLHGARYTS
jgi:hypothetical protein